MWFRSAATDPQAVTGTAQLRSQTSRTTNLHIE
jgi:hypothetical protein